jgi:hypothetical protein
VSASAPERTPAREGPLDPAGGGTVRIGAGRRPVARIIILIDLLLNGCLGLGFARCARDRIKADGPFASPAFFLVATFAAVVLTPITLYLYLAHPGWSWMYLVDPATIPSVAIVPLVVLVHAGMALVGWYVGARLLRAGKGKEKIALYALAAGSLLWLALVALARGRLGRYGTYAEYHDGRALDLMDVKLGYVLVAVAFGAGAAALFVALELGRDSRRVRTR